MRDQRCVYASWVFLRCAFVVIERPTRPPHPIRFLVQNHGIPQSCLDNVLAAAQTYFSLPMATKMKVQLLSSHRLCSSLLVLTRSWLLRSYTTRLSPISKDTVHPSIQTLIRLIMIKATFMKALKLDGKKFKSKRAMRRGKTMVQWQVPMYGPQTTIQDSEQLAWSISTSSPLTCNQVWFFSCFSPVTQR